MYSRSLTKDYRWIYSSDLTNGVNNNAILRDYEEFEKNKEIFLREKHLIIRQFHDSIAMYKFIETKEKDQNSRKIYALLGCMFSEFDFEIEHTISMYFVAYLYNEFDILFERFKSNIPDKKDCLIEQIEFSLDLIIETIRTTSEIRMMSTIISNFCKQFLSNNYIIKNNYVNLISWEVAKPIFIARTDPSSPKQYSSIETSKCKIDEDNIKKADIYDRLELPTMKINNEDEINCKSMNHLFSFRATDDVIKKSTEDSFNIPQNINRNDSQKLKKNKDSIFAEISKRKDSIQKKDCRENLGNNENDETVLKIDHLETGYKKNKSRWTLRK